VHSGFWWGNLRESQHFEDKGVDGRIILKFILKLDEVYLTDLTQDRDR
jgi:hypothetical protein